MWSRSTPVHATGRGCTPPRRAKPPVWLHSPKGESRLRVRTLSVVVVTGLLALAQAAGAETIVREATVLSRDGVTMAFPAITYEGSPSEGDPVAACARAATAALGVAVDPSRDLLAEAKNRIVFRAPGDPAHVVKLYRPDRYDPARIATMIQRDLAVAAVLSERGLNVATLDTDPKLLAYGVLRQRFVTGTGVDERYPAGYRHGADPALDRVLAEVAAIDRPVRAMVASATGLLFFNTVDCREDRPLGIDLGHCYGNIVFEKDTGAPLFIDW
jgi:hypothetical protein